MHQKMDSVEDDHDNMGGRDLDEKPTAQNFMNAARQGDLSSRQTDKDKLVGNERKKQQKEISSVQGTGVQTRRTLSKFIN